MEKLSIIDTMTIPQIKETFSSYLETLKGWKGLKKADLIVFIKKHFQDAEPASSQSVDSDEDGKDTKQSPTRCNHIIKWVGGKSCMINEIKEEIVKVQFKRFVELFAGSMAVGLTIKSEEMIINDINPTLIGLYSDIQRDPKQLLIELKRLNSAEFNTKEAFGKLRDKFNEVKFEPYSSEAGAIFIYLNRRCFNGKYRENQQGIYNNSYRHYKSDIYEEGLVLRFHQFFKERKIQFFNQDYKLFLPMLQEGDLVYLDPPYYPGKTNTYTGYHQSGFPVEEQLRLKDFCDELDKKGVKFIQSNGPCDETRELYKKYRIRELNISRGMRDCGGNVRESKEDNNEMLIMNF